MDDFNCFLQIHFRKRGVDEEHEAVFSHLLCVGKSAVGLEAKVDEDFFKIDLAASAAKRLDAGTADFIGDPLACPPGFQCVQFEVSVKLVIGVFKANSWLVDFELVEAGEAINQDLGVARSFGMPVGEFLELEASNGRLHFGHACVCAE